MRRALLVSIVASSVLALSARADAQSRAHQGFMAQAGLGVGFLAMSESAGALEVSVSGVTGAGYLALGGHVIPGLAVHGTLWSAVAFSPSASVRSGGTSVAGSSSSNSSLTQTALGAGVTYTLPALDMSFTGSLGVGLLSVSTTRGRATISVGTDPGFAVMLGFGKHWAVSRDWGLGLLAAFNLQTNSETLSGVTYGITTVGGALMFSATFH